MTIIILVPRVTFTSIWHITTLVFRVLLRNIRYIPTSSEFAEHRYSSSQRPKKSINLPSRILSTVNSNSNVDNHLPLVCNINRASLLLPSTNFPSKGFLHYHFYYSSAIFFISLRQVSFPRKINFLTPLRQ